MAVNGHSYFMSSVFKQFYYNFRVIHKKTPKEHLRDVSKSSRSPGSWSSLGEIQQDDIARPYQSLLVMVKRINVPVTHLSLGTSAYYGAL